jgi:hypothetical protein
MSDAVDASGDEIEDDVGDQPIGHRPPNWSVQIVKLERTIFELHRSWKKGSLDLQPEFQREFVWPLANQVALVESVLLRIPLPVIYLSEESEVQTIVIDGQQRLTTLFRFMDNKFPLKQPPLLPDLEGRYFQDLDGKLQRRFEDSPITTFVVQPGSDPKIKFEVFQRLNQGSVALNAQEIRNCLFRGPGLALLKDLAGAGSLFRRAAGTNRKYARMRGEELVLRTLAFLRFGPAGYDGDMREFLNHALDDLNKATEAARTHLRGRFERAVQTVIAVFTENAFRRYEVGLTNRTVALNAALMDVLVFGFGSRDREVEYWRARADKLVESLRRLHQLPAFMDAITLSTGDVSRVRTRFSMWLRELDNVEGDHA